MFIGEYECSIDTKGRLMLPAKFRDLLNGQSFIITKGSEKQVVLYPQEKWEEIVNLLNNTPQAKALKRFVIGSAQECEFDSQGRFTIQTSLKQFGEFSKKATVIGMGDQIEIWAQERYQDVDIKEISEVAANLGIDF